MAKYRVTVARDLWEQAWIEVEASNEKAAEVIATEKAWADDGIEWERQDIRQLESLEVEEIEPATP